jgi:hypothetical protein
MRIVLFVLAIVAAASATGAVDEQLLVPHALDAAETSDREILESLDADEETTTATKATTTTTTTTSTTTTSAPTTVAVTLSPEEVHFLPATRALLSAYNLNARKLALAGFTDERARALVQRMLQKRALAIARKEEALELKKDRAVAKRRRRLALRRRRLALRRRRLAVLAEVKRKRDDYIPLPLKRAMTDFGFNWQKAEAEHETVSRIKEEILEKEREEEHRVSAEENQESETVAAEIAKDLAEGLKGPLEEEQRVAGLEKRYESAVWTARESGRRHEARVLDTVKRRQKRLRRRLQQEEIAIEQQAKKAESAAETQASTNAAALRDTAQHEIEDTEEKIVRVANKAAHVSKAAQHWLDDQEEPAIKSFVSKQKRILREKLLDVGAKARVRTMSLRKKLADAGINEQ